MAQQIINVGSAPNDGTGDLLRNSQIKANANFTELYNSVVTNTSDLINDGEDGVNPFISLLDLPSNLILYPTTATSDVSGYVKLVTDIHDVDYNTTAVDVTTGSITGTNQLIASLITNAGLIVGNAGVFNTTTIGNIRKTAGAGNAEFYYLIYKRTSLGVETLVGTSNPTIPINSAVYIQFNTVALWDDGIFDVTDRIVLKFYASKVGGGSSPTYDFQFGGTAPVRTLVPVALSVIPTDGLSNQITDYTNATLPLTGTENLILNDGTGWKKLTWTNIKAQLKTYFDTLYQSILVSGTNIKTINGTSVLGSGDLVVSGGGGTLSKYIINFSFGSTWLGNLNANWRTSLYATNTNIYDNSIGTNISQFNGTTNTLTSATDNRYTSWTLPYNCKLKEVISHMGGPLNVNIDFKIIYWEAPTSFGQSNFTYLGRVYYPISGTGGKIFPTISELNTTTTLNKGGHVLIVWFNNTANPSFTTSLIQAIFEEV